MAKKKGTKVAPITLDQTRVFEHGQDDLSAEHLENGIGDSNLTNKGINYAEEIGKQAQKQGKTQIISSNVKRAVDTADIAASIGNLNRMVSPILNTWNIGEFEKEKEGSFNEPYWVKHPNDAPVNGESFSSFTNRMQQAYQLIEQAPKTDEVITHSKVTRAMKALEDTNGQWTPKTTKSFLEQKEENMKNGGWLNKYEEGGYLGYDTTGRDYSPAWGGRFQDGGELYLSVPNKHSLNFLQPLDKKLKKGYIEGSNVPSTERASSIGGENGEPAYLIPSFKYGHPVANPIDEFNRTGDMLGGPFKTWQDADKWEKEIRHPYVEKGQNLPSPLKWWQDMQVGGSIPGTVGFSYGRVSGATPSNGKYAKKTLPSAQNGKMMTYYQNGLDFEPKTISQNGNMIPFQDPRFKYDAIPNPSTVKGRMNQQVKAQDAADINNQAVIKQAAPQQSKLSKALDIAAHPATAAKYVVNNQPIPDNFTLGDINSLEGATSIINPLSIANTAGTTVKDVKDMALHPSTIQDKFLPTILNATSLIPIGKELMSTEVAKNAMRAKGIKEFLGKQLYDIPYNSELPRASMETVKDFRKVQDIGRMKDLNKTLSEQMQYGLDNNISNESFEKVFGIPKADAPKHIADMAEIQKQSQQRIQAIRNIIAERNVSDDVLNRADRIQATLNNRILDNNLITEGTTRHSNLINNQREYNRILRERGYSDEVIEQHDPYAASYEDPTIGEDYDYFSHLYEPNGAQRHVNIIEDIIRGQQQHHVNVTEDVINRNLSQLSNLTTSDIEDEMVPITDIINPNYKYNISDFKNKTKDVLTTQNEKLSNFKNQLSKDINEAVKQRIGNYPLYRGNVTQKVPSAFLSNDGVKEFKDKVDFAPENIQSGEVFTGSTNTSHSSYLPQLKQVFKYDKGSPQFLGFKPMNDLGYLSKFGYDNQDIVKYLNSEIDEQVKRGVIPNNIYRPFLHNEHLILPQYGVKQHKEGGVIKDNRGQYAHPGKITQIDSNNITMKNLTTPIIGVSNLGEVKLMEPEKNYIFAGDKVTEYPIKTNWLDKYNS